MIVRIRPGLCSWPHGSHTQLDSSKIRLAWQLGSIETDILAAFGDDYSLEETLWVLEGLLKEKKASIDARDAEQ